MIRGENEMMDTNRINMDELDKVTGGAKAQSIKVAIASTNKVDTAAPAVGATAPATGNTAPGNTTPGGVQQKKHFCTKCDKDTMFNLYTGGRAICSECGDQIFM